MVLRFFPELEPVQESLFPDVSAIPYFPVVLAFQALESVAAYILHGSGYCLGQGSAPLGLFPVVFQALYLSFLACLLFELLAVSFLAYSLWPVPGIRRE